ncbi:MAG: hypothetical protein BWX80_02667 [Candidatus Hydrogenedentes bacterium ADurb.Bin101]|nr:MAG: hypothetical protein BWX80_02667 [Candidatus Hydrogenedentes bacterium ADurb.Bin101]
MGTLGIAAPFTRGAIPAPDQGKRRYPGILFQVVHARAAGGNQSGEFVTANQRVTVGFFYKNTRYVRATYPAGHDPD